MPPIGVLAFLELVTKYNRFVIPIPVKKIHGHWAYWLFYATLHCHYSVVYVHTIGYSNFNLEECFLPWMLHTKIKACTPFCCSCAWYICKHGADSRFAPSQWETSLHSLSLVGCKHRISTETYYTCIPRNTSLFVYLIRTNSFLLKYTPISVHIAVVIYVNYDTTSLLFLIINTTDTLHRWFS